MRLVPSLAALCAATSLTAVEAGAPVDRPDADEVIVVVTAQRLPEAQDTALQPVAVIAEDERRSAGYPTQPIELVADLPGVWLQQTGAISGISGLRLRGAPDEGTLVLFDGVPIHDPAGLQSDVNLTVLNPAGIATTEVLRGPQSGLYGSRAIGGVVHFRPLVATEAHQGLLRLQGGSFETVDALAQATGPIGGSSGYAVGLSGTRSQGISALTTDDNGDPLDHEEDGLERAGAYGRLEHRPLAGLTIFVALDAMQAQTEIDDFMQPDSEEPVTDYNTSRLHTGARLVDVEEDRFSAGIDLAYSLLDREMPEAAFGSKEWNGREIYASIYGGWRPVPLLRLSGGVDLRHESADNTAVDGTNSLDEDAQHLGLWLRSEVSQQRWGIAGTLRHDDHSEKGDATTWQLTAAVEAIPQRVRLNALVGTTFRAPSLYESLSQDAVWGGGTVGNPDLEPEEGFGFAIGHRSTLVEHVVLANTLFSTRFDQRITWDSGYANSDDKERIDGVESELLIEHSETIPLELSIAYTWQSFDHADGLSRRLPETLLRSALTWYAPHDLRLQVAVTAVDERSDGPGITLERYTLVDLAASWRIDHHWEVFARGENISDEDYELADGYATPGAAFYLGGSGRF